MSLASADSGMEKVGAAPRLNVHEYAAWKPRMENYLTRAGVYPAVASEIKEWTALVNKTAGWEREREDMAVALVMGTAAVGQDGKAAPSPADAAREQEARKVVCDIVSRSQRAYATLYESIPEEVRRLTQHIAKGYAYGLWHWLGQKFQSTEQDNIMSLFSQWFELRMKEDEQFDEYRARVDSLVTLLKAAKQEPTNAMYAFILLDRLNSKYKPAVLALKASDKLKSLEQVNWEEVSAFINAHERSEQRATASESERAAAERTMAINKGERKTAAPTASNSGTWQQQRGSPIRCTVCGRIGHYAAQCTQQRGPASSGRYNSNRGGHRPPYKPMQGAHDNDRGKQQHRQNEQVSVVRQDTQQHSNRYEPLSDDEDAPPSPPQNPNRAFTARTVSAQQQQPTWAQRAGTAATQQQQQLYTYVQRMGLEPHRVGTAQRAAVATQQPQLQQLKLLIKASDADEKKKEETKQTPPPAQATSPPPAAAAPKAKPAFQPARVVPGVGAMPQQDIDTALASSAWGVDSMASLHITGNKELLSSLKRCAPTRVQVADGGFVTANHKGQVRLRMKTASGDRTVSVTIDNVFYHERFTANLLSWGMLRLIGWQLHSTKDGTHLITPNGNKVQMRTSDRVTVAEAAQPERAYGARGAQCMTEDDLVRLHERLGHIGFNKMIRIMNAGQTMDIEQLSMNRETIDRAKKRVRECKSCAYGKGTRSPFGERGLDRGNGVLHTMHVDTFEVRGARQDGGSMYGVIITDPHCEGKWFIDVSSKAEIADRMIAVIRQAQTQTGHTLRRLHCDGGTEFINHTLKSFLTSNGTQLCYPPARTQQLNGIAERSVRTMKDAATTLLAHAGVNGDNCGLINNLWVYACHHHTYMWNRTHIAKATGTTPYEAIYGRKPSVKYASVFGCDVYCHIDRTQRDGTFASKMEAGVYMGHDEARSSSMVYVLRTGKVIWTRDIDQRETQFNHIQAMRQGREQERATANKEYRGIEPPIELNQHEETVEEIDDIDNANAHADKSDEHYPVEAIIDKKVTKHREQGSTRGFIDRVHYEVKWKGYNSTTWEPEADLIKDGCAESILRYEQKQNESNVHAHIHAADEKQDDNRSDQEASSAVLMVMSALKRPLNNGNVQAEEKEIRQQMAANVACGVDLLEGDTPETYRQAMNKPQAESKA